ERSHLLLSRPHMSHHLAHQRDFYYEMREAKHLLVVDSSEPCSKLGLLEDCLATDVSQSERPPELKASIEKEKAELQEVSKLWAQLRNGFGNALDPRQVFARAQQMPKRQGAGDVPQDRLGLVRREKELRTEAQEMLNELCVWSEDAPAQEEWWNKAYPVLANRNKNLKEGRGQRLVVDLFRGLRVLHQLALASRNCQHLFTALGLGIPRELAHEETRPGLAGLIFVTWRTLKLDQDDMLRYLKGALPMICQGAAGGGLMDAPSEQLTSCMKTLFYSAESSVEWNSMEAVRDITLNVFVRRIILRTRYLIAALGLATLLPADRLTLAENTGHAAAECRPGDWEHALDHFLEDGKSWEKQQAEIAGVGQTFDEARTRHFAAQGMLKLSDQEARDYREKLLLLEKRVLNAEGVATCARAKEGDPEKLAAIANDAGGLWGQEDVSLKRRAAVKLKLELLRQEPTNSRLEGSRNAKPYGLSLEEATSAEGLAITEWHLSNKKLHDATIAGNCGKDSALCKAQAAIIEEQQMAMPYLITEPPTSAQRVDAIAIEMSHAYLDSRRESSAAGPEPDWKRYGDNDGVIPYPLGHQRVPVYPTLTSLLIEVKAKQQAKQTPSVSMAKQQASSTPKAAQATLSTDATLKATAVDLASEQSKPGEEGQPGEGRG
ncbi:unnamed protein product, partial [Amoebophrya sp. A25]